MPQVLAAKPSGTGDAAELGEPTEQSKRREFQKKRVDELRKLLVEAGEASAVSTMTTQCVAADGKQLRVLVQVSAWLSTA